MRNGKYSKPKIGSYSGLSILEELGVGCTQYQIDIYPSTDDWIVYDGTYGLGSVTEPTQPIEIGTDLNSKYARAFYSFDISGIHGTVVSATLKIYQTQIYGTPYSYYSSLAAEQVVFSLPIQADSATWQSPALSTLGAITDTSNGWKEFDAKNAVTSDKTAGRTVSEFKARFSNDGIAHPGDNNYILTEDTEGHGGTTNKPVLTVTYE